MKNTIVFKNFSKLTIKERKNVYIWRNLEYIRKNMDNPEIFPYRSHVEFCKSLATRTDKIYFLVIVNNDPCGVLDFVDFDKEQKKAESGFYIIKEYNHFAYAVSRCANYLCNYLGIESVYTHVLNFNTKAILYNLMKLKGSLIKEDKKSVYFKFSTFYEDFNNDSFWSQYDCKIVM